MGFYRDRKSRNLGKRKAERKAAATIAGLKKKVAASPQAAPEAGSECMNLLSCPFALCDGVLKQIKGGEVSNQFECDKCSRIYDMIETHK